MPKQRADLLEPWAGDHINAALSECLSEYCYELQHDVMQPEIASPLEAAFLGCWRVYSHFRCLDYWLVPQFEVTAGSETYRLDFIVLPNTQFGWLRRWTPPFKVGVELDGHNFHERTKAQVITRDKRDRDLTSAGWCILHFSGSEFNANPWKCINAVCRQAANSSQDAGPYEPREFILEHHV